MSDPYADDLSDLKKMFKIGVLFAIPDIQRKMFWGYNRARNTIDFALSKKAAVIDEGYQGLGQRYRLVK